MKKYKISLNWHATFNAESEEEAKNKAEKSLQDDINNSDIIQDFDVEEI